jgi:GH25 family lysozyme M1 (1,4-beta-N-acetylmuramidase)
MAVLGVDVSSYQPVAFPTKGLSFAFVKATEGTVYVNPRYAGQVAHARAAGLVVGHYHFAKVGGAAEADYFLSKAKLSAGDILAFDWETAGVSQAQRDAFMARVKAKAPGHKVVLYCNTDYWRNRDTDNGGPMDGLWIADPNHPAGKPNISHAWVFHQYSWAGGIDRNVANFKSADALRSWAHPVTVPAHFTPAPAPAVPLHPAPPVPVPVPAVPLPKPAPTIEQRVSALEADVKALQAKVH